MGFLGPLGVDAEFWRTSGSHERGGRGHSQIPSLYSPLTLSYSLFFQTCTFLQQIVWQGKELLENLRTNAKEPRSFQRHYSHRRYVFSSIMSRTHRPKKSRKTSLWPLRGNIPLPHAGTKKKPNEVKMKSNNDYTTRRMFSSVRALHTSTPSLKRSSEHDINGSLRVMTDHSI